MFKNMLEKTSIVCLKENMCIHKGVFVIIYKNMGSHDHFIKSDHKLT